VIRLYYRCLTDRNILDWMAKEPTADELKRVMASLGKKGGPARMAQLTPDERKKLAQKGAAGRWGKKAGKKVAAKK
jgi:hypothetical protein